MPKISVSMEEEGLQESNNFNSIWHTPTHILLVFCNRKEKGNDIGCYFALKGIVCVVHNFHQLPTKHPV